MRQGVCGWPRSNGTSGRRTAQGRAGEIASLLLVLALIALVVDAILGRVLGPIVVSAIAARSR